MMVNVLTSNAIDRGFESRSGQTKDYKIGICYLPLIILDLMKLLI